MLKHESLNIFIVFCIRGPFHWNRHWTAGRLCQDSRWPTDAPWKDSSKLALYQWNCKDNILTWWLICDEKSLEEAVWKQDYENQRDYRQKRHNSSKACLHLSHLPRVSPTCFHFSALGSCVEWKVKILKIIRRQFG